VSHGSQITGVRAEFVIDEAIAFAIEGMSRLPSAYRPAGKISDLKDILSKIPHAELALLQEEARRRVDILLDVPPPAST